MGRYLQALVLLGLLTCTSLTAAALVRLVVAVPDHEAQQSAAAGCQYAPVEALAARAAAVGRATLCMRDDSLQWTLDLEQLADHASYTVGLAIFDRPDQCRFGALAHYVAGFRQPCALDDLTAPQAHMQPAGDVLADAAGTAHLTGVVGGGRLARSAQVWLLLGPAPAVQAATRVKAWVARALFHTP
jgi:hypothetical protein